MRQQRSHINVAPTRFEPIQELGKVSQSLQPLNHDHARNILDPGHHIDEHIMIGRPSRREAHPAVTYYRGGHAMRRRRVEPIRPDRLTVVVGVQLNEPRRDQQACRIDLTPAHTIDRTNRHDDTTHRDVAPIGRSPPNRQRSSRPGSPDP